MPDIFDQAVAQKSGAGDIFDKAAAQTKANADPRYSYLKPGETTFGQRHPILNELWKASAIPMMPELEAGAGAAAMRDIPLGAMFKGAVKGFKETKGSTPGAMIGGALGGIARGWHGAEAGSAIGAAAPRVVGAVKGAARAYGTAKAESFPRLGAEMQPFGEAAEFHGGPGDVPFDTGAVESTTPHQFPSGAGIPRKPNPATARKMKFGVSSKEPKSGLSSPLERLGKRLPKEGGSVPEPKAEPEVLKTMAEKIKEPGHPENIYLKTAKHLKSTGMSLDQARSTMEETGIPQAAITQVLSEMSRIRF